MGKPPFTGDREQVCQQICQSPIDKEQLFSPKKINDFDIDDDTKDIIINLLKRERKERLGCLRGNYDQSRDKKSKRNGISNTKYGIEGIMNHAFFECIWNKNKDYQYTWDNIRKRQHKPAPILRHLATRATDSPRERLLDNDADHPMHSFNDWKDDYDHSYRIEQKKDDDIGSMVDTTDDEEFQTDEDDEKSMVENSKTAYGSMVDMNPGAATVAAPILLPNNDEYTNTNQNIHGSINSTTQGISPLNPSPLNPTPYSLSQSNSVPNNPSYMFPPSNKNDTNTGLSPLPQSPPLLHKASVASAIPPTQHLEYGPPPTHSPQFMPMSNNVRKRWK